MLLVAELPNGLYHLGEGYQELDDCSDPSRANEAHKLLALAANDIDNRSKNKRPNNLQIQVLSNSDTNYIHTLENKLDAVINCLVSWLSLIKLLQIDQNQLLISILKMR